MSRRALAASAAAVLGAIIGTAAGLTIGVRAGWYHAAPAPVERCPIVEVRYSPPVAMSEALAGGRPSGGGRYALRECDNGATIREWLP